MIFIIVVFSQYMKSSKVNNDYDDNSVNWDDDNDYDNLIVT